MHTDPQIRHRVFDQPGEILHRFNAAFLDGRLITKRGFCQNVAQRSA